MITTIAMLALDTQGHAPAKPAAKTTTDSSYIRVYQPGETEGTEALHRLMTGNERFLKGAKAPNRTKASREKVAQKQTPFASVLTCADSRLAPELIFDQGFGDLFVVRVAGNVADTFGIASLEYAAEHLGSKVILVMGHERCGAVKAACDTFTAAHASHEEHGHAAPKSSIPTLVEFLLPSVSAAAAKHPKSLLDAAIAENADLHAQAIFDKSPLLKDMLGKGEIALVSGVYDLDTGRVTLSKAKAK